MIRGSIPAGLGYAMGVKCERKNFHTEVCVLKMDASTHSQNMEANYEK